MKKIFGLLIAVTALIAMTSKVQASHVAGGNITYECLGNGEYLIRLTLYNDCSGINPPTNPSIGISGCGTTTSLSLGNAVSIEEVSNLCAPEIPNSTCNGGSLPGFEEVIYEATINLSACDCYTLSYSLCCRNSSDNLTGATGQNFYIESELCSDQPGCNNSPVFPNAYPLPYYCEGSTYNLSLGAYDPDGDSLVFSFANTMGSGGANIGYQGGYSSTQPIPGITINPQSGVITFTAGTSGTFAITLEINEYDENGNLIGTYFHDFQIIVQSCPPNSIPDEAGGGIINDNTVNPDVTLPATNNILICEGADFCFDLLFEDPDATDSIFVNSNIAQIFPGTTINYTYTASNSVTATVCGNVPPSGPSNYFITFDLEDDFCPFPNTNLYSVIISTTPSTSAFSDATICQGDTVNLSVVGGSVWQWVALPGGDPISVGNNFECDNCDETWAVPSTTTSYEVTSTDLTSTCGNVDTVTITVAPDFDTQGYTFNATCVATNIVMDSVTVDPGDYTYQWDPANFLNDPTLASPVANFGPQGTYEYIVTVTNAQGCVKQDTVTVVVGAAQQPEVNILMNDTAICVGGNIPGPGFMEGQIDGGAGNVNDYNWTWTPNTGLATPNDYQTNANPNVTQTYILTAVDNVTGNCQDSDTVTINVINANISLTTLQDVSCFGFSDGSFNVQAELDYNENGENIDSAVVSSPTGNDTTFINPNTSFNVNNINAGFWTVTVYTSSGCSFSNIIEIEQPPQLEIVLNSLGQPSCNQMTLWDGSININVTGGTPDSGTPPYQTNWYLNAINTPSIDNSLQLISLEPGVYIAVVEDAVGCVAIDTFNIVPPDPIEIDTTITRVTCPGENDGSIIIDNIYNTTGTINFDWTPNGETSQNLIEQEGGDYTLTITDAAGCIGVFDLTIPTPPDINLSNTNVINSDCFPGTNGNGQVSAQASGGWSGNFTFQWFNAADTSINSSNPTWGNRPPGDYILIATDDDGCEVIDTFTVAENPVVAGIEADPETGIDPLDVVFTNTSTTDTGTVNDNFDYIWNLDNGVTFETEDVDTLVQETFNEGIYTVTLIVRNANGCRDTATVIIDVIPPLEVTPPNVFTPNGDGANDLFRFDVYGVESFYCVIYDRWGKEVFIWTDHTSGWDGTRMSNGNEAPEGAYTYMYEIQGLDGTERIGHGVVHLKR